MSAVLILHGIVIGEGCGQSCFHYSFCQSLGLSKGCSRVGVHWLKIKAESASETSWIVKIRRWAKSRKRDDVAVS